MSLLLLLHGASSAVIPVTAGIPITIPGRGRVIRVTDHGHVVVVGARSRIATVSSHQRTIVVPGRPRRKDT